MSAQLDTSKILGYDILCPSLIAVSGPCNLLSAPIIKYIDRSATAYLLMLGVLETAIPILSLASFPLSIS
jgi:hypothetical protein